MKIMKIKKALITVISLAAVCGAVLVGITIYKNYQKEKIVAGVLPVSDICWDYTGDESTSYGMLTNDSAQEIYLDDAAKVETVYVKQGDTVKAGDALLKYNTAETEAEIKNMELNLVAAKNTLEKGKHELETLRKMTPVKEDKEKEKYKEDETDWNDTEELEDTEEVVNELPERDEKDERIYNYLTEEAVPFNAEEADGSWDKPYIFYVNKDAYAYGSFYNAMRPAEEEAGKYFMIAVCQKDENGKMLLAPLAENRDVVEQMIKNNGNLTEEEINEMRNETADNLVPQLDNTLSQNIICLNGNSLPTEYDDDRRWYIFSGTEVEEADFEELGETETTEAYEEDFDEPQGYTAKELSEMIAEKEKEVKQLDIEVRTLELTLNSLKEITEEGVVYAKVDGIVKTVADLNTEYTEGDVFMVVTKDARLYVSGTVNELLLDRVQPGAVITANSWETGMTFEAVVTEVSDYPTEESDWSEGNPNVSYYRYTAFIEDSSELKNGEYVDLLIREEADEALYIEKAFVREEDGQSYVMIADKNERLKKQYVITGKTIEDGSAIEIKAGLTEDDRIAFPYGEGAVEGVNITEDYEMYY